jgi:hypothetical protein
VNFKSTNKFDIRIAKSNKKILWQVYNVCFVTYISICNILKQSIDERLTKDVTESSIAAVASDNQQKANSILKETDILNNEMNHKAEPLQKKIGRGIVI